MALIGGYNPYDGILDLYDPKYNSIQKIRTIKLADNKENEIINLFRDISEKCKSNIQLLCVKLGCKYKNKFRKKFVKIAKSFNILSVKIIGRRTALLQGAISCLNVDKENENIIWVFDIFKKWIHCNIWERKKNDIWKFNGHHLQKTPESVFIRSEDLQALKERLNPPFKDPFVFVCSQEYKIQEEEKLKFKRFISNQNIYFLVSYEWSKWALNYGRDLYQNPVVSDLLLERHILVVIGDAQIIEYGYFHYIPSKSSIKIPIEDTNLKLKVFEDNVNTKTMIFGTTGIVEITLNLDENGIFVISLKSCPNIPNILTDKGCYNIPPKNIGHYRKSNAVGIDFGTTQCSAAVIRSAGPDCIELDSLTALRTIPSYIGYDEREPKCGQLVINRMRYYEKSTVFDTKRMLGKNYDELVIDPTWSFTVIQLPDNSCEILLEKEEGLITLSAEEVTASLLKHIKAKVDDYQHKDLKEAVISIPSAFTEKQKSSLLKASKLAGWDIVHFIPEPIAAAFAYSMETEIPNHSKLLIFDFGGGTIDISIVDITSNNLQVLSFDGNYYLGGRDFDALLYNHLTGILKHKYKIDIMGITNKYLLLQKCQEIKHTLSVTDRYWLDVSDFCRESSKLIYITKKEFESMAANNITQIKTVILNALKKAHLRSCEINYVVQVGGSSRMPMIKKFLLEMFPNSFHKCSNMPDWKIAEGAALYAYYLEHEEK